MKVMTTVRDDGRAMKAMFLGVLCTLAVATSTLDAAAAVDATAPALTAVDTAERVAGTMLPIPNPGESAEIASKPEKRIRAENIAADSGMPVVKSQGEKQCLTTAIYFEARGESAKGQQAVAEVIVSRSKSRGRPNTICGVVYEGSQRKTGWQFSFTCDRIADRVRDGNAWDQAQRVADTVLSDRGARAVAKCATFFHASNIKPYWASSMNKVAQIGSHVFYRP